MNNSLDKHFDFQIGDKTPDVNLVFLHGLAADATCYEGIFDFLKIRLAGNIRFVAYDWLHAKGVTFANQLSALQNSLQQLDQIPTILIAHSMGTIIASRYASLHPKIKQLVLISAPIFTPVELQSTELAQGLKAFRAKAVTKTTLPEAYEDLMQNIVLDPKTYANYEQLTTPVTFLYGTNDSLISIPNIKKLCCQKSNFKCLDVEGKHGLTPEKYDKLLSTLEEIIKK